MEYEENPLPILHYGSYGLTITKSDIYKLGCEGIAIDNDNETYTENVLRSEDIPTDPTTINIRLQGIVPWRQSGNLPVGKTQINLLPNIRV